MRSEFQFIQHIKEKYSLGKIGDDCAVLPQNDHFDSVVTADMLVEDIDFRLEWTTPELLGHKALAVSLSDIAAMGGEPRWAMLSVGVPEKLWLGSFLDEFYAGWHELAANFGVELVGGDVSRTPDKFVIDSIVGGNVTKGEAMLRSSAIVNDAIFVSGSLGGPAAGLKLLESGITEVEATEDEELLIDRFLRPQPRVDLGKQLMALNVVTSCIDLSDGLSSDLAHICLASEVGAIIISETIPIDRSVQRAYPSFDEQLEFAMNGGEDFELLFTVNNDAIPKLSGFDVTRIGTITSRSGCLEISRNGESMTLPVSGFRHF